MEIATQVGNVSRPRVNMADSIIVQSDESPKQVCPQSQSSNEYTNKAALWPHQRQVPTQVFTHMCRGMLVATVHTHACTQACRTCSYGFSFKVFTDCAPDEIYLPCWHSLRTTCKRCQPSQLALIQT